MMKRSINHLAVPVKSGRFSVHKAMVLAVAALVLAAVVPLVAQTQSALEQEKNSSARRRGKCVQVSGSMSTNFITEDTTLGTVAGDLRGAISATLLELTPGENGRFIGQIQHRGLVTESGDKIFQAEALIDLTPVSDGVFYSIYRPIIITGGTGRFKNATGTMSPYGVVDINRGEVVLRYRGEVCTGR